jgi:hypothetical protein
MAFFTKKQVEFRRNFCKNQPFFYKNVLIFDSLAKFKQNFKTG